MVILGGVQSNGGACAATWVEAISRSPNRSTYLYQSKQHLMAQLYGAYPDSQDAQDTSES